MRIKVIRFALSTMLSVLCFGGALLLAPSFPADAKQSGKVWRIGYLGNQSRPLPPNHTFRQAMRDLGYVEGKNFAIEWGLSDGRVERLPALAADLVRLKVDCIVAVGVLPTRAAKQATSTIPIVMGNADDDPVRQGLVASLARPGGNVTGFFNIGSDLAPKRLELLKETIPKLSRVAILFDPASVPATVYVKKTEAATPTFGVRLQPVAVRAPEELEGGFRTAVEGGTEALLVVHTALFNILQARVVKLAGQMRLPDMHSSSSFVLAGGLMSYATDEDERWRGVATYVDRILKGTKPADLPVQRPAKFEFVINLKTARQIGLTIPPNVLARADKVIR